MYEELRDLIRHGVATMIFRATVTRQAAPAPTGARPLPGPGQPSRDGDGRDTEASDTSAPQPAAAAVSASGLPGAVTARQMQEQLGDRTIGPAPGAGGDGGARPGHTPAGDRIGRNDPCWCGSGVKYKKCHGR
jgi:preprotein translocase subunit SecA